MTLLRVPPLSMENLSTTDPTRQPVRRLRVEESQRNDRSSFQQSLRDAAHSQSSTRDRVGQADQRRDNNAEMAQSSREKESASGTSDISENDRAESRPDATSQNDGEFTQQIGDHEIVVHYADLGSANTGDHQRIEGHSVVGQQSQTGNDSMMRNPDARPAHPILQQAVDITRLANGSAEPANQYQSIEQPVALHRSNRVDQSGITLADAAMTNQGQQHVLLGEQAAQATDAVNIVNPAVDARTSDVPTLMSEQFPQRGNPAQANAVNTEAHRQSSHQQFAPRTMDVPVMHQTQDDGLRMREGAAVQNADVQKQVRAANTTAATTPYNNVASAEQQSSASAAMHRAEQMNQDMRLEQMTGSRAATATQSSTVIGESGVATLSGRLDGGNALGEMLRQGETAEHTTRTANDRPVSERIVRGLTTMLNQRGGSMTMRLDPPELGQLRIQMAVVRGVVHAQFQAGTQQAQQIIERNIGLLRTALEGQGLTVERLTVQVQPSQSGQQASQSGNEQTSHGQKDADHDAGDGQSRGRDEQQGESDARGFYESQEMNVPRSARSMQFQDVINDAAERISA